MTLRESTRSQLGLSMIDILVGVAIGMIGIVIMFQVFEQWDTSRHSTGSGSEAQISGSIAIFSLERDLRQAGYGFGTANTLYGMSNTPLGATVDAYLPSPPTGAYINTTFRLAPVRIVDSGVAGTPDQIISLYGNSPEMHTGIFFRAANGGLTPSKETDNANGAIGLKNGELLVATFYTNPALPPATVAALVEVTSVTPGVTGVSGDLIHHDQTGTTYVDPDKPAAGPTLTARYNPPNGSPLPTNFALVSPTRTGVIFNLGNSPRLNTWTIQNNRLVRRNELIWQDTDANNVNDWFEVSANVINMQAEYGLDTNNDNIVDCWTPVDPDLIAAARPSCAASTPQLWSSLRSIRVALLARSDNYSKTDVTTIAPTWSGGAFVMTNADGTPDSNPHDPNDWRRYRYRIYESTIPLRNMVWGTAP